MKSCFDTIYPDLEKLKFGKPLAGKIFQIYVSSQELEMQRLLREL